MRVLVSVASRHGSTWEIACTIGSTLNLLGIKADVIRMEDVCDITRYHVFILGSAVYMGRWLREASDFIDEYAAELARHPVWLFSSGPLSTTSKQQRNKTVNILPITRAVRCKEHHIFAGKLRRGHLKLAERIMAPAISTPQGDFRNWQEIRMWTASIAWSLQHQPARR